MHNNMTLLRSLKLKCKKCELSGTAKAVSIAAV